MTTLMRTSRKALAVGVMFATAALSLMASMLVVPRPASAAGCVSGTLIKGPTPAVYYCGADGKRYVFTNDKAFFTWYADFSGITTLTEAELGAIAIGGNVTYRPGRKMIKIQSDPKVYVVAGGGTLRHIPDEACAKTLYGADWNKKIDDISDAFFVNYKMGAAIGACSEFNPQQEMSVGASINADKALGVSAPFLAPFVASVTPANGATDASVFGSVAATFSAAMDASTLNANTFTLRKAGASSDVAGAISFSGLTATFDPSMDLEASATYTATITSGAKNQGGVAINGHYTWTFRTASSAPAPVQISAISPPSGGTGVATSTPISVTFSGAMDASTINGSTFIVKKGETAVAGTVTYASNKATFAPTAGLEAGATYTVTLTTGAKDPAGNGVVGGAFTWSFTVAS